MIDIKKYLLSVEKPMQYMGNEVNSVHKKEYKINMCLFFPDIYDIGMSNLGIKILYNILNNIEGFSLERGFSPMEDMESIMRENSIPMFSLESCTPLMEFDVVGFSLSYEMDYTNVLNALNLANIPLRSEDRNENHPLIMAGGTSVSNPTPMSRFIDYFVIGDGEEVMTEISKIFVANYKLNKFEKLELIKNIEGVYIPKLHENRVIKRAVVRDFNSLDLYYDQIVPFIKIVHDRALIEIQRGCTRGCRFCQAGITYRPIRERSLENNLKLIDKSLKSTGYSEISLSSLSSSDYTDIESLLEALQEKYKDYNLGISLPSLRMNPHSVKIMEEIKTGKKTGFTFAPEAGSQRLRDVINKGVTEKEIIDTAICAVKAGWITLKFYFMIGLPFETEEDIKGIYDLVTKVVKHCKIHSKRVQITVSIANFIPKPHTPFQWAKQMNINEMKEKHKFLRDLFYKSKNITLKIHNIGKSYIEGFLSRGNYKTGDLLELVYKKGAKLEDIGGNFKFSRWEEAMKELELSESEYLGEKKLDVKLPWDIIDIGVTKEFLLGELKKSKELILTPDCRENCVGCGMKRQIANCGELNYIINK